MRRVALAMAVALAFVTGASSAATINVTTVGGSWGTVLPANNATVTGSGTSQLKWGTPVPAPGLKSGYGFVGQSTMGVALGTEFNLGTFTHYNNPIAAGTSITEAVLTVSVGLTVDGIPLTVSSVFRFLHNETSNLAKGQKCANGQYFGSGVNKNGCADKVTFASVIDLLQEFQIGDTVYNLQIAGFKASNATVADFWTMEKNANSATLLAKFSVVRVIPPPPPPPPPSTVPLPATGLLLLAGLGGLAVARRRRA